MLTKEDLKNCRGVKNRKSAAKYATIIAVISSVVAIVFGGVLLSVEEGLVPGLIIMGSITLISALVALGFWNRYWSILRHAEKYILYEVQLKNARSVYSRMGYGSVIFEVTFTTYSGKERTRQIFANNYFWYDEEDDIIKLVDKKGRVAYNEEDDIIFLYDVDLDSKIEEKEV
jgi:hypothetical protein